jgi:hypothetical protein
MGGNHLALLFVSWVKAIPECLGNDTPCNSIVLLCLEVVFFAICIIPDSSNVIFNPFVNLLLEGFLLINKNKTSTICIFPM